MDVVGAARIREPQKIRWVTANLKLLQLRNHTANMGHVFLYVLEGRIGFAGPSLDSRQHLMYLAYIVLRTSYQGSKLAVLQQHLPVFVLQVLHVVA